MKRFIGWGLAAIVLAAPLVASNDAVAQSASAAPATPASATPASAEAAATLVNQVQAFYDQSQTFKSPFKQKFTAKLHRNLEKTSSGTVLFAKPGKMLWTYKDPEGNVVASNGKMLKIYEKSNDQMYEQNVDKSQYPAALSFLVGGAKLADTFNFEMYDGKDMSFPGGQVLVGVPKQPNGAYAKVLFYVDTQTKQVRRAMIIDNQGNRNRFDFEKPEINVPVKDGDFEFTPPKTATIIKP